MNIRPQQALLTCVTVLALSGCSTQEEERSLLDLTTGSGTHVDYDPVNSSATVDERAAGAALVRLTGVQPGHQRTILGEVRYEFASLTAEVVEPLHGPGQAGDVVHLEMIRPEGADLDDLRAALPDGEVVAVWSPWTGDSTEDASLSLPDGGVADDPAKFLFPDGLWHQDSGELENPMVTGEEPGSPWAGAEDVAGVARSLRDGG